MGNEQDPRELGPQPQLEVGNVSVTVYEARQVVEVTEDADYFKEAKDIINNSPGHVVFIANSNHEFLSENMDKIPKNSQILTFQNGIYEAIKERWSAASEGTQIVMSADSNTLPFENDVLEYLFIHENDVVALQWEIDRVLKSSGLVLLIRGAGNISPMRKVRVGRTGVTYEPLNQEDTAA